MNSVFDYDSDFGTLVGEVITKIDHDGDIIINTQSGRKFKIYHDQDCCESVGIEKINGDLNSIVGSPIISAEEENDANLPYPDHSYDSHTFTVYKLRTREGWAEIVWLGTSNGYYSETPTFSEMKK